MQWGERIVPEHTPHGTLVIKILVEAVSLLRDSHPEGGTCGPLGSVTQTLLVVELIPDVALLWRNDHASPHLV
jgi:hypothetical protein